MLTYLALGDSYTIGEGVALAGSFPYQTVQLLRKKGWAVSAPEIVAATGWTTDELAAGMDERALLERYDWVSLLIGVNNQYRGRPVVEFAQQFETLLQRAIGLAGGRPHRVWVLSIPDWGVTPFAEGRNRLQVAQEIDAFNAAKTQICGLYRVRFVNITEMQRLNGGDAVYLAADRLHPSGTEYARWAEILRDSIKTAFD